MAYRPASLNCQTQITPSSRPAGDLHLSQLKIRGFDVVVTERALRGHGVDEAVDGFAERLEVDASPCEGSFKRCVGVLEGSEDERPVVGGVEMQRVALTPKLHQGSQLVEALSYVGMTR